jgi:RNA polymerase-binding transcription factor
MCYRPAPMSPGRKPSSRSAPTSKKPTKKTSVKKAAPKKTAAKKTTKKTTAKKAAVKKTVAKKTTAKAAPKKSARSTTKATKAAPKAPPKSTVKKKTTARAPAGRAAPKAPPAKPVRAAKFDKKALDAIRAELKQELVSLQRRQTELEADSFEGTQSDMTGEVGLDEDFADAGTATFDRERDLSIRNNIRDLIDQITRAMGRIDDGRYGTCERCGKPIDAARLKALPHALLCMDCKRREERAR